MKKVLIGTTVFFGITTIALAYILVFTGTEMVKNEKDTRITVKYPPDLKKFVLSEMRDYLEVINEINRGLAENNPDIIIKAANRQGKASIDDTPARLLKLSPLPCKKMGFRGHDLFQAIADSAKIHFNPKLVQKQLSQLTNNCIICHKTYKIQ